MKCITYGTLLFYMIIITFIYGIIMYTMVEPTKKHELPSNSATAGTMLLVLIWIGMSIFWISGFFRDCK